jgi:predicted kinase
MLDKLVADGDITADLMRKVSRTIAEFHRTALTSETIADHGRLDKIIYNWQENFDQTVPFENMTLPAVEREIIRSWITKFAAEHENLFQQRLEEGFIRECDGDIHLENICIDNDAIYIFDCIEFNDRFRCCDTAADISFLLMDLDFHGRYDLSEEVIKEYVSVSGDFGALAMIDFYKIYRAFVRGKVESFRLNDSSISPEEQTLSRNKAIRYFMLARGYIERFHLKPTLFITCGLMGTGKSTLTSQLAFELGIASCNSDIIRKQLAGIPPEQRNRDAFNEGLYDHQSNEATYAELLIMADRLLTAGSSVIIDASFSHRDQRAAFAALADRHKVPFIILHIVCSDAENRRRLLDRESSGSSVSDGRLELLAKQTAAFVPPEISEGKIITLRGSDSPAVQTSAIYSRLFSC